MTTFSLRHKDTLQCPSNFVPWKCHVKMLLEEHDLWVFVEKVIVEPKAYYMLKWYQNNLLKPSRNSLNE